MNFVLILTLILSPLSSTSGFAAPTSKPKPVSLKELQAHAGPVADDEDDDEADKFERHQEEDDGGDPYPRYAEASSKDGNCDPTFLRDLYRQYAYDTCNISLMGTCTKWWDSSNFWWGYATTVAPATALYSALDAMQMHARVGDLRGDAKAGTITAAEKAELEHLNRQFVGETRKMRIGTKSRLLGRSFLKSSVWGVAAYIGLVFANSELGARTGAKIYDISGMSEFKLSNCPADERDPVFRENVPIQSQTCKTPLYEAGNSTVIAFFEKSPEEQLKALQNKYVCGYYKSLNVEMVRRNGFEDTRSRIEKLRCDHATGKIAFQFRKIDGGPDVNHMSINRRPGTQEFESYEYEKLIKDVVQEQASYDLAKKEDDILLVNIRVKGRRRPIPPDRIQQYEQSSPAQAKNVLGAFRSIRRVSRNLALCCDLDPPVLPTEAEKKNIRKRVNVKKRLRQINDYAKLCPKDWFNEARTPIVPAGPAPKAAH